MTGRFMLNIIRKGLFHLPEIINSHPQKPYGHAYRYDKGAPVHGIAQQTPPETINNTHHWVQRIQHPVFFVDDKTVETNRAYI